MRNDRNGPLSYAPAFAALLGITFSLPAYSSGLSLPISALVSVLMASAWIFLGTSDPAEGWRTEFIFVVILTAALSLSLNMRMAYEPAVPTTISSEGKVLLNREWGRRRALLISVSYGKMTAYMSGFTAPAEGSGVKVRAAVFDFKRAEKGAGFGEYLYWKSKGAVKKIIPLELEVTSPPAGIHRWRNFLKAKIEGSLPDLMSGYMLALTLGIRDRYLTERHREAGTVHLLAVSGFHVGILAAMAGLFLKRGRTKILAISVLIWSYLALAGFPPGGIRAGIMLQVYLLGLLLGRPSRSFNSVSVAGIIMLIWDPWTFYDMGWRLSMLAALSVCASAGAAGLNRAGALIGSAAVWLVTAPLIASAFGEVPVVGLLINIAAIPLFSAIFPLVFLCSLPAFFGLPFSSEITSMCEYLLESWDIISGKLVELMPFGVVSTVPLAAFAAFVFFASALYASGTPLKKIPLPAVMFSLLVLLSA